MHGHNQVLFGFPSFPINLRHVTEQPKHSAKLGRSFWTQFWLLSTIGGAMALLLQFFGPDMPFSYPLALPLKILSGCALCGALQPSVLSVVWLPEF